MNIVIDRDIPYIKGQAEKLADNVVYLPGAAINAKDVRDADVLIIRTRTRCDRNLLEGSRVRYIATATIGYDHLDTEYLFSSGITWANCPGCNAKSVGQYIRNSLYLWAQHQGVSTETLCVGIVGVGNVGTAVQQALAPLGCQILLNDPPRAAREGASGFSTLEELQQKCNVISIHTPLILQGLHPTFHLFNAKNMANMVHRPLLINTGRGEVVDNVALEKALDQGQLSQAIIDTWENEPNISLTLLEKVFLGTPHIAGYSADGKVNATRMSLQAVSQWMGKNIQFDVQPPSLSQELKEKIALSKGDPQAMALMLYNPRCDSDRLKNAPDQFEQLRSNYPLRRESIEEQE